jgi:hypothetical protein
MSTNAISGFNGRIALQPGAPTSGTTATTNAATSSTVNATA